MKYQILRRIAPLGRGVFSHRPHVSSRPYLRGGARLVYISYQAKHLVPVECEDRHQPHHHPSLDPEAAPPQLERDPL